MKRVLLSVVLLASMLLTSMRPAYASSPKDGSDGSGDPAAVVTMKEDNKPDPLTTKQLELKEQALEAKLNGKANAYGKVGEVARGQYVQLAQEGEGHVWTILGEFSDIAHNQIPQPDRAYDNSTLWVPDFSKAHFDEMLYSTAAGFNSMNNFYIEQSSGRYGIAGEATDWVKVGEHLMYDDNPDSNVWFFLRDVVNGWYAAQIAAGKTPEQINEYLKGFDVWDRYDYDGDGDFNEPDGYIDHLQAIHAGEGEEAGADPTMIWSHSWYAYSNLIGVAGPAENPMGGIRIGDSDFWLNKYTIQPENGGVGVFTHEYGHDLGLPDLYATDGGDNGTAFWTLMSSGSWMGDGTEDIGSKSSHMGAWEKFQLGWLNYEVARAGVKSVHKVGPMEFNTKQAQAVFVVLPKKTVVTTIGTPFAGSNFYYSGAGDNLDNTMTKSVTLPAGTVSLSAMVRYNIELDWDYAYLTVNGNPVPTNLSTSTDPNGQNKGFGITGVSNGWVNLTADLSAYAGQTVTLGFRYWTDTNTGGFGFMVDDLNVTGLPTDGAEADAGWAFKGFKVSTGTESALKSHYYIAELRTYKGYDSTLKTGPYYFGYLNDALLSNKVDHFPYQDGLLINYWDTSQKDNRTKTHPGAGLLLPIDAHYAALKMVNGSVWRNRIQSYDATFGLEPTDALNLHVNSVLSPIPSLKPVSVFDDSTLYWDEANPQGSVKNPNTGTQIRIQSYSTRDSFMQIEVRPAK